MARRSPAPGNPQRRIGQPERLVSEHRRTKTSGDLEQRYFEFDRGIVARVLGTLQGAINAGAAQMEMVVNERMFDKALSGTFARAALHLDQMAQKLEKLLADVTEATGYPKIALEFPIARAVVRRIPMRPL